MAAAPLDVNGPLRIIYMSSTPAITFVATAAAIFVFVVKPINALMARTKRPEEDSISDEERRHQELLAALDGLRR